MCVRKGGMTDSKNRLLFEKKTRTKCAFPEERLDLFSSMWQKLCVNSAKLNSVKV